MSRDSEQCSYEFAPGVRCMKPAGHDEPYYPYLDYGQWGKYSDILNAGSAHLVVSADPAAPPREEWTGNERKGSTANWAVFGPTNRAVFGPSRETT